MSEVAEEQREPGRTGVRSAAWRAGLNTWSVVSLLGLVAAGVLAVGLGVYIPRQVEARMLESQATADHQVLQALLSTRTLTLGSNGSDFAQLDRFVRTSVLRGDYAPLMHKWLGFASRSGPA